MNNDLISRKWLIDEYHRRHQGPPGGALEMIQEAPAAEEFINAIIAIRAALVVSDSDADLYRGFRNGLRYALSILEQKDLDPGEPPAKIWHKLSQRDFPPEGDVLLWMDTGRCGFPRLAEVKGNSIYYWDRANSHETWLKRDEWSRTRWTLIDPPEEEKKANAAASE